MKVYTVQINYKSGSSMQAEFKSFTVNRGDTYSWETYGEKGPIILGVDNIESVWQISVREVESEKETV